MRRRDLLVAIGAATAGRVRAQTARMPVIAFLHPASAEGTTEMAQ